MKKTIILLLVLILSFSLIGCGVVEKDESNEDKAPSNSAEGDKDNSDKTGSDEYLAQSNVINNIEFKRVSGEALLTEEDVESVAVGYDEENGYYLYIEFTTEGAAKLASVTAANVGNTMQIATHGEVIISGTINEAITGGKLKLTGSFNYDDIMHIFNSITK